MKWLVTVDSSEEETEYISYVELSHVDDEEMSDKQISDVTEKSCAVQDNAREVYDKLY